MAKVDQGLFKGVAVVIDDGIEHEPEIQEIVGAIRAAGGHAVTMTDLPDDDADLENFCNAAFFIMDWNLQSSALGDDTLGVDLGSGLKAEQVERNIKFLRKISGHRHAPVFIFTNESPESVRDALREHTDLYTDNEQASHIIVRSKSDVGKNVYEVLNAWADDMPSVKALKIWEREWLSAVNGLFVDFHNKSPYWPVLLWQAFKADEVPASDELGRLITRLVASRMHPIKVDLDPFEARVNEFHKADPIAYNEALLRVLEGERFLRNERLDADNVAPGDVFFEAGGEHEFYYINVRPECDCVLRGKKKDVSLYLLRGRAIDDPCQSIDAQYGRIPEQDNQAIVFAMIDGKTVKFLFRDLHVKPWSAFQSLRVGRLLPPFSTSLFQRYAAYSHRPGLPRIPPAFYPAADTSPGDADAAGDAPTTDGSVCSTCDGDAGEAGSAAANPAPKPAA